MTLTNDPLLPSDLILTVQIDDGAVACVGVTVMPGSVLRAGSYIVANSTVEGEILCGSDEPCNTGFAFLEILRGNSSERDSV